jgi:hypothetical protein
MSPELSSDTHREPFFLYLFRTIVISHWQVPKQVSKEKGWAFVAHFFPSCYVPCFPECPFQGTFMVTFILPDVEFWIRLFWFAIQIASFGSKSGAIQSKMQIQDDGSLD